MSQANRFSGVTVQFLVPELEAATEFYSRLFGRRPDFEPHDDFVEWEVVANVWLQVGEGEPRPACPVRLRAEDIDAECLWVNRELGVRCSRVTRIPGLVAFCNFSDPWGNNLGFYQRLFLGGMPRAPGGSFHDWEAVRD